MVKMNSLASKRPSSARRHIKQETFSSFVSSTRLRHIQSLLHKGNGDAGERCDALLCILGIDSRYNDGSRQLVDYLLFNFFDTRKTEIERSGYDEEVIDDMIFLIRRDRVDVYCNPINYLFLLPYIAHWRNLRLHCMTEKDYEDDEAAEMFKITSFVSMVDGCQLIGVPYAGPAESSKFDKMSVEKWPIVQAFAHEEIGGGGFFTMKYKVVDMSEDIDKLYHRLDPVSLETVVTEQLPLFERQWSTMMTAVDSAGPAQLAALSERTVSESLWSYFNHGRVGSAGISRGPGSRNPFALFGCHSGRSNMEKANSGQTLSDTTAGQASTGQALATHVVCQAVAPRGPLSCTRTYFFGTGVTPHPVTDSAGEPKADSNDLTCLSQVYKACVKAAHAAINVYTKSLSVNQAVSEAWHSLKKESAGWDMPGLADHVTARANIEISIEAHDNNNSPVPVADGHHVPQVKTVSVTVYDVPSPSQGSSLGSVSFADSFIDSALHVQRPDGSMAIDAEFCILTQHVPCFVHWPYGVSDAGAVEAVKAGRGTEGLGQLLVDGETASLLPEDVNESLHQGTVYVYERGVAFTHQHLGAVVLPKSHMEEIYFYDGDTSTEVALLILCYKEAYLGFLPHHVRAPQSRLIIGFVPRSKAYKALYSLVLPEWKKEDQEPVLQRAEDLPEDLQDLQSRVQAENEAHAIPSNAGLRAARARLPRLKNLLEHYAASSSVADHLVPQRDVHAVAHRPTDAGGFPDEEELVLTILTGVPGSHKDALCNVITRMCKEDSRWAVIRYPIDHTEPFSGITLQAHLTALVAKRRAKSSGAGGSKRMMRALIVTPGFTDTVELVQAISNHPNKDIAAHLKIGAVTVCIDHTNMFMKDRYTLPKLLDQCGQGWVNNIVFTGPSNDKRLSAVQDLVRAVNTDVALLLAEGGHVTRSPDLELILSVSAFSDSELLRARYLSCPGWRTGSYVCGPAWPSVAEVGIRFSRPLDKARLLSHLKGLKEAHNSYPCTGNIYNVRGRVVFKGSSELQDLRYVVLSGHLQLTTPDKPGAGEDRPACCVVFTGCGHKEDVLRDWLRQCAPQKPEKKSHQTRKSIAKSQIKKIHDEHHLEPLPDGWFYNGSRYVSLGGDKSDMHPCVDDFVENYLEKVNREVDAYNARVDGQEYHDLFS